MIRIKNKLNLEVELTSAMHNARTSDAIGNQKKFCVPQSQLKCSPKIKKNGGPCFGLLGFNKHLLETKV